MSTLDEPLADRATTHSLIQPRKLIFRPRYRRKQGPQMDFGDLVSHWNIYKHFFIRK